MITPSSIETVVMKRVHRARVLRVLFSNTALAAVVAPAALYAIGREVWVAKVFANGPHDLVGHLEYLGYAFLHAHLSVEILSLTALAALVVLARETARSIATLIVPAHA